MKAEIFLVLGTFLFGVNCYTHPEFFNPQYHFRSKRHLGKADPPPNAKEINPKWNSTWTDKLKKALLLNYDKFARPAQHGNTTSVTLDPTVHHVELDETRSIMTVHGWIKMTWQDEKIKWNPADYGGIKLLHLADHEIWQPDLFPYNSASGNSVDHYGNSNCLAHDDGTILWVPPSILHVFCELDFRKWPFDTQVCSMKIGSWTYNGLQIDLKYGAHDPEFENLLPNAEWKFVKLERQRNVVHYACCPEPYVDLQFNLTLERRSPTYKALVITPATTIVLMTLATFWLPPTSGDKLMLGGATAIIICLFLLYFTQKLSVIAGHTPLIVLFYSSSLYLVSFSVVLSVIVINLSRNPKVTPIPWILKNYLTGWLGRCLLIENFASQASSLHHSLPKSSRGEEMTDSQPVFSEQQDLPEGQGIESTNLKSCQHDWLLVAVAIDRIAFLLYCFLFIVFALAYSM